MKSVRFAPLTQTKDTSITKSEALYESDINLLWWSRAERKAIKKKILNFEYHCERLSSSEASHSKGFLQAYQHAYKGEVTSPVLEAEFIFEVAKERFDRGVEKYVVNEIMQVHGRRQKKLKELIFFIQDSPRSKSLGYDRFSELLRLASEKCTLGSKNVAHLYGKADAHAVKNRHYCNVQAESNGFIIKKGSVIANPAA
jgi:hypothetical protein